jgi:hypothetical protein
MSDKLSMVDRFFPTEESRRAAASRLISEAEKILSRYDSTLVAEVSRRRKAGEGFRQIFEAMGRHPDVPGIGMQLAVILQAHRIREGTDGLQVPSPDGSE